MTRLLPQPHAGKRASSRQAITPGWLSIEESLVIWVALVPSAFIKKMSSLRNLDRSISDECDCCDVARLAHLPKGSAVMPDFSAIERIAVHYDS